jgi:hypothetical protein
MCAMQALESTAARGRSLSAPTAVGLEAHSLEHFLARVSQHTTAALHPLSDFNEIRSMPRPTSLTGVTLRGPFDAHLSLNTVTSLGTHPANTHAGYS